MVERVIVGVAVSATLLVTSCFLDSHGARSTDSGLKGDSDGTGDGDGVRPDSDADVGVDASLDARGDGTEEGDIGRDADDPCEGADVEACTCPPGYEGYGDDCTNIDECLTSPCDENATCTDEEGSFACECVIGYVGDGFTCELVGSLETLRVEMACDPPSPPPWCNTANHVSDEATMNGSAGRSYEVTLRIRGVAEEKTYFAGAQDGHWYVGGWPQRDDWNVASLTISDPAATYYLNAGSSGHDYCDLLSYERTVLIAAGASVALSLESVNSVSAVNVGEDGAPIVVPDVPPHPDWFDGQFIQVDATSVVGVP